MAHRSRRMTCCRVAPPVGLLASFVGRCARPASPRTVELYSQGVRFVSRGPAEVAENCEPTRWPPGCAGCAASADGWSGGALRRQDGAGDRPLSAGALHGQGSPPKLLLGLRSAITVDGVREVLEVR